MAKVERYDVLESEVFVVPHKNNSSCTMAFYFLKENLHGTGKKTPLINHWREHCEYEALCEGDDYWIAPEKLKMQVAILDDNDGISLCSTAVVINGVGGFKRKTRYPTSCVVPLKDILSNGGGFLTTVTYLYRINKEIMNKPSFWENCHVGDYPLAIFCGLIGQVLYINEFTSCYRYGIGWTKHFYELPIKERISRWKSEIDMLNGFNEFSGKKYNQVFCSSIINFLFITIILDNYENRELFKDFHKYLHPSNLKEMLKVIVIKYKYAGALYHLVMKLVW